jgi:lipopolysaccharide/colanic/teichoic acid biosynthesis glycosyltransferase
MQFEERGLFRLATDELIPVPADTEQITSDSIRWETNYDAERAHLRRGVFVKRLVDVLLSLLLLPVLLPVFLLVSLAIRVDSSGPIFFRHRRLGLNSKPFFMLKFRSMVDGADKMLDKLLSSDPSALKEFEESYKLQNDPRCTRVGRWLRRTSLDELPQVLNVLRGEMSFVGPRAIVEPELEKYGQEGPRLLLVKPGITGLWQVSGRSDLPYPERVRLDMSYIDRQSVALDLWVLLRTIFVVLHRTGAV